MYEKLHNKLQVLENELLIESAYFVVEERGVQVARRLHEKGVKIRVLTNSLASNDVVAAHAGYANCREALIEAGVEIYELRADSVSITVVEKKMVAGGKSKAALHTKAMVFDHESIFVGSFQSGPPLGAYQHRDGGVCGKSG
ncbi:hypothetical protein Dvar_17900 [Desulfosarcina variabilis str. Montpellier]|uniref:phospholipase D-like domain-containing protein n=1 Tax=Desulfosarcina variabilis TaxID=2300 RepID=UPI003AFA7ACA